MILMIDWGNSYLKFIEIEALTNLNICHAKLNKVIDLEELSQRLSKNYQDILISSVRSQNENVLLTKLLTDKSDNLFFATTNHSANGINCAYEDPSMLGVDRWLGILAVGQSIEPAGIISIGTAITIDIVVNQNHLGGQILPGRQLMFNSLKSTGQVRAEPNERVQDLIKLGENTSDCVNFAIETAIQGYLQLVVDSFEKQYKVKTWVVTGGGAKVIKNLTLTTKRIFIERPVLVFEGLMNSFNH